MVDSTKAFDLKVAFHAAAQSLFPSAQVVLGNPGTYQSDDVIEFGTVSSQQEPRGMSTNRSREETLEQEVIVSVFRGGGIDAELSVFTAAYDYLNGLAEHVRVTDTAVGGTVRECFLTSHQYASGSSDQSMAQGRIGVIVATFTARARITS